MKLFVLPALALLAFACEPAKTKSLPDPGPAAATVTFTTDPPGASVVVDGVTLGAAPQTVKLRPGPHKVKAQKSGYFAQDLSVVVSSRETKTVPLTLVASH